MKLLVTIHTEDQVKEINLQIEKDKASYFDIYQQLVTKEVAIETKENPIVAVKSKDILRDWEETIENSNEAVQFYTFSHELGKQVFWHSSAHLLAQAVLQVIPEAKPTIGPPIEEGFYYDFYMGNYSVTDKDIKQINTRLKRIQKGKILSERTWIPRKEAIEYYEKLQNKFKIEIIKEDIPEDPISFYKHKTALGEFLDLCRGPHMRPGLKVGAIRALNSSSAFWRGNQERESLQRIYGISFPTKQQLDEYFHYLEEAKARDHRRLGIELDLFFMHEWGPGTGFFTPKGAKIYNLISQYLQELYEKNGYFFVRTPQIFKSELWKCSGHYQKYKDNMFWVDQEKSGWTEELGVKPMNCPGHALIFKRRIPSYQELPLRYAEYGFLHRNEASGTLHGLLRLIGFVQDDAHIFCREDQLGEELQRLIELVKEIYKTFGLDDYEAVISTKPEQYIGSDEIWEKAETILFEVTQEVGMNVKENPGDGAFYGPKIDFIFRDSLKRKWQLGTIQLDFNLGPNFELKYMAKDGSFATPVVIHRAILGSIDRFLGVYIEHTKGAFPLWLSPTQVEIIPVKTDSQKITEKCEKIRGELLKYKIRAETDFSDNTLQKKIRRAQVQKIPYMLVIGQKEVETNTISVRKRDETVRHGMTLDELLEEILTRIETKDPGL